MSLIKAKQAVSLLPLESKNDKGFVVLGAKKRTRMVQGRKGNGRKGKSSPSVPPTLETAPAVRQIFRFQNSNATTTSPTVAQLMTVPGMIGTVVNTSCSGIASSIRIHSIKIWLPASGFAEVSWVSASGYAKDDSKDASLPTGIVGGSAPYSSSPPKGSLAADWLTAALTTQVLFTIGCTIGSIIDVDLSFVMSNNIGAGSQTVVTAALGTLYYAYLDGPTTHYYLPIGRPSTF
jgi:hypothetical protein